MSQAQPGSLLRIHVSESDRLDGKPLYEAIVAKCREMKIAGRHGSTRTGRLRRDGGNTQVSWGAARSAGYRHDRRLGREAARADAGHRTHDGHWGACHLRRRRDSSPEESCRGGWEGRLSGVFERGATSNSFPSGWTHLRRISYERGLDHFRGPSRRTGCARCRRSDLRPIPDRRSHGCGLRRHETLQSGDAGLGPRALFGPRDSRIFSSPAHQFV